jgi:hypothetical protein
MGNPQTTLRSKPFIRPSLRTSRGRGETQTRSHRIPLLVGQSIVETLELRRLLSTAVNLAGDAGASSIYITRVGDDVEFFQNVPVTASPTVTVPYADLGPVSIISDDRRRRRAIYF